jgi:hypothetical protein
MQGKQKHNQRDKTYGPAPERVKIEGDWTDAMKKALAKKRPGKDWPKPEKEEQRD